MSFEALSWSSVDLVVAVAVVALAAVVMVRRLVDASRPPPCGRPAVDEPAVVVGAGLQRGLKRARAAKARGPSASCH